ncbi:peptide deformylase [Ellagibacter isourolithinifaciens]|uniref:peptide deformylase n=1 Tax=Ellagibacter isourolithinifaciens TaxID=2137581 RepID=UPI002E79F510|nr:peptide deformylase [Ellagibacter isourolithinifaciens]MEE0246533.1 peptide deformylase [Ellagibacter isourolithinifaciens]
MIRPIVKMPVLLSTPSVDATLLDAAVGQDLLDTLAAHAHECVGLAANMIGVRKRIIVASCASGAVLMYNPEIIEASGEYQTEESCLSLEGVRPCARYKRIKVAYLDASFAPCEKSFSGFEAQIIQHEIDHCHGVVI